MVSFAEDLNRARPRTPLRLFEAPATHSLVAAFNEMIRREFCAPIREALAHGPSLLFGEDPQLSLF